MDYFYFYKKCFYTSKKKGMDDYGFLFRWIRGVNGGNSVYIYICMHNILDLGITMEAG